jgi:RND superfamily putative drug exporter
MFSRIGRLVAHRAKLVLTISVLVMLGAGALGFTAFGKLKTDGGFGDPNAESTQAQELLDREFGGQNDVVFLFTAETGTVDDPANRQAAEELTERLAADATLVDFTSYYATGAPPLRSADGRHAIAVAKLPEGTDAGDAVEELRTAYDTTSGPVDLTIGGPGAIGTDIGGQVGKDLALAEMIAVPIILILLVLVFGSVVAALLPLAIGGLAVLGTFAVLSVLGSLTDVSVFSINLTTALGLGLAIDYALLMVNRYREELAKGLDEKDAVVRTVETAGRTIMFSAATVAVALAVLLVFPAYFLRSFAYAGVGVVLVAMIAAIFVLPALLSVLGPRVNAGRLPWVKNAPSSASALWGRVAEKVMKRPALFGGGVAVVLIIAALPLLRIDFGNPNDQVLPTTADSRIVGDALRAGFPTADAKTMQLITTGPADVTDYAGRLSELPGVVSVTTADGTYADGQAAGPGDPAMIADSGDQRLVVLTEHDAATDAAQDLVAAVRDVPAPTEVLVGGGAARLVDSVDSIGDRLPLAITLIALSTFLLLFLFTGSVFQPIRALLFNVLGLSATLGLMVLIFQEGWLSDWLNFTPMPLDTSMVVLLFCIVFGLSMDYEVFVISRIKEMHDAGAGPAEAVTQGLSRTGRLISMAAVLLAVSLLAFGTSGVSFIQMFGIGSGLAILVDATLIRGVLVPVGMRLLGRAAWWAPRGMRRVHERVGLKEEPELAKV